MSVYSYLDMESEMTKSAAVILSSFEFSLANILLLFFVLFLRFSRAACLSSAISVGIVQVLGMKS